MKKFIYLILILCCCQVNLAQTNSFQITPTFQHEKVQFGNQLILNTDTLQIDKLELLLSNFYFLQDGKIVDSLQKKFHRISSTDSSSFQLVSQRSNSNPFNSIRFTFGIDSLTHSLGVLGGDLDPMYGQYWTWQSGYIFLKLEGTSPSCPARKNKFQFHIGGYQVPFVAFQTIEIPFKNTRNIEFELDKIIDSKGIHENYQIMSPSEKSVEISHRMQNAFHFSDAN